MKKFWPMIGAIGAALALIAQNPTDKGTIITAIMGIAAALSRGGTAPPPADRPPGQFRGF